MENKYFFAFTQKGDMMMPCTFVTDLDEEIAKREHLDKTMSFYDRCMLEEDFLCENTLIQYLMSLPKYFKATSEEEKNEIIEEIKSYWSSIYDQERPKMIAWIKEQQQYIKECSVPIFQRRERVSVFLERIKTTLLSMNFITLNGRIRQIPNDIPADIFHNIYYLLADAICCRFQLNQYDGMYRDGLHHCLQYLDYRFWHNDFSKQYPNATEEFKDTLRRTNILDIVTGRDNAEIEVYGEKYKCSAFLEDGGLFRLRIDESIPWNISNATKEEFNIDKKQHTMWSVDERYTVKLNATQMTYYVFVYEKPDMDIEQMLLNEKLFRKCSEECGSGGEKLRKCYEGYKNGNEVIKQAGKVKSEYEKELKKRISEINKKVRLELGEAYSILEDQGKYYIPISKDKVQRPEI